MTSPTDAAETTDEAIQALRRLLGLVKDLRSVDGDMFLVLGRLQELAQRVPPVLRKLDDFLVAEVAAGRVRSSSGTLEQDVADAKQAFGDGCEAADALSAALYRVLDVLRRLSSE